MAYVNYSSVIPFSRSKVFEYVSDIQNFPDLVPRDYKLELTAPPLEMKKGAEYEFRLSRFGVSHLWSIRVDEFEENVKYVERQILGLFNTWILTCELEDHSDDKTLLKNTLEYDLPLGLMGKIFDDVWLRKDLTRVFEEGHKKVISALEA